jgi:threonine/homoserine/homoserine lactone efflux protein
VIDVSLLGLALSLGAASAISPGPLLILIVSTTLHRGFLAGLRIAVAPLLTDAPVLGLGVFALDALSRAALDGIRLAGGLFLMAFGIQEALYARRAPLPNSGVSDAAGEHELLRGVAVNLLNPNAWLLLLTVMAPLLAFTWPRSPTSAVGIVVVFYLVLVSGKVAIAASLTMLRLHFQPAPTVAHCCSED